MKLFSHFLTSLLCLVMVSSLNAQRIGEDHVETEKLFIEASREKILGNYENAVMLYKEVLKKDKSNHAAAYELARMYDVLDKDEKALGTIKMAIALDKTNEWYKMFYGDVLEKAKKDKEAAKVYEGLVSEDPNTAYYYHKWAFYLVRANETAKAIKVYDKLESKFGVTEELSSKKHRLYLGLGKQNKATEELKKLCKFYPSSNEYKHMLAGYYKRIGETDNAKKIYQEILKNDPDDAQASIALVTKGSSADGSSELLTSLKPIFQNSDVDIDVKIKEMIPYIKKVAATGDIPLANQAIELSKILVEVHPKNAKSYSVYGDLLNHSNRPKEALGKYMQTLELDNSVFTVWEQVMYLNYQLRDFDALLKNSEEALDLFPNQAKAHYLNGIANSEKGKFSDAISAFEQALMMSARNPKMQFDIYGRLGEAYHYMKKYNRSEEFFEKALEINPRAYTVLDSYSYHLSLRGASLEKAKKMSELSNELKPNEPTLQDTYGFILYKMKDYNQAKEWLEKALKNGGEEMPTVLEHYGDLLHQLDKKNEAIMYWQKAQDKGSTSENLKRKILGEKVD